MSVLITQSEEDVNLKALKLMSDILTSHKVPPSNKDHWRLTGVGFGAVTEFLTGEVSADLVEALLHLGAFELPEDKGVDTYGYYDVILAVVDMITDKTLDLKLCVSQMVHNLSVLVPIKP